MLSSKFRPRVIPMLYSFYLIVYLICISYFILLFSFFICCFFVCRLYIGFSFIIGYFLFLCLFLVIRIGIILSLTSLYVLSLGFCVCFLGSMIISGILFIYYFYDDYHWLMIILFYLFICCFGLWVYNPCDMGIIYIIELGFIYSISFCLCFLGWV